MRCRLEPESTKEGACLEDLLDGATIAKEGGVLMIMEPKFPLGGFYDVWRKFHRRPQDMMEPEPRSRGIGDCPATLRGDIAVIADLSAVPKCQCWISRLQLQVA